MASPITIKRGNTRPWTTTLTSAGDDDLTDVASIAVYMRKVNSTSNTIDGTAAVLSTLATASSLPVTYNPSTANVSSSGDYNLYWRAVFTTGSKIATWPSKSFDKVIIESNYE